VTLRAPALVDARFEVLSLEGEERLNALPVLTMAIRAAEAGMDGYRELLSTELVSLQFEEQGRVLWHFHGMVVDLELAHREEERGTMFAQVRVAPRLWLLERNVGSELFVDASFPEIIAQKLNAIGLKEGEDYRFALSETYPRRELTVQYEESDLAFVQRLCEHLGIITRFEHTGDHDRWVLTDMPDALGADEGCAAIPVRIRTDHPAAYGVTTRMKRGAQSVAVHAYNYRAPRLALPTCRLRIGAICCLEGWHPTAQTRPLSGLSAMRLRSTLERRKPPRREDSRRSGGFREWTSWLLLPRTHDSHPVHTPTGRPCG